MTGFAVPTLATPRLTLRAGRREDFDTFADVLASDHARHMDGPLSPARSWSWFCSNLAGWALTGIGGLMIEADGETVGYVSVGQGPHFPEVELGWLTYPGHLRRGYAAEAAAALRDWAWSHTDLTSLVSYVTTDNAASRALAEKLGAVPDEGAARPQGPQDCVVYCHRAPDADGGMEAYA